MVTALDRSSISLLSGAPCREHAKSLPVTLGAVVLHHLNVWDWNCYGFGHLNRLVSVYQ